ncbi:heavy metal transport/detoxification protein [Halarcobacter ebronensis]|uniref:Heavy metal transport/detoxification protein n=1 Tax=Halarcobacter ebronensis TaxID=1462615 RepID=A0A4Q0YLQ3_9BACT|nr:heavy-metal-associated domain-containing protein [Halarcobacter ebronensis]RXJ70041.1 heavy metal transport/detoxification protein [Halarcobacter ebronensis]
MKKTYKAENISCNNCANMIKASLGDEFENIEVNLNVTPKEVTLDIKDEADEKKFKEEMADIGFPVIND